MKYYLFVLAVLVSSQLYSQSNNAGHIKTPADHWSYLQQFATQEVVDDRYMSDAAAEGFNFGNTFCIEKLSEFQFQFQVLTNKRYGKLKKRIYIGVFELTNGDPKLIYSRSEDVVKLKHSTSTRALVQVVQIDTAKQYVILVAGRKKGKSYTVRTAQQFLPNPTRLVNANGPTYEESKSIIGKLWLASSQNRGTRKITLRTISGEVIEIAVPDDKGQFRFENLPFEESFIVELDEQDHSLEASMHLFDNHGVFLRKGRMNSAGSFKFDEEDNTFKQVKLLERSNYALFPSPGKTSIAGIVVDNKSLMYGESDVTVDAIDVDGKIIASTTSDEKGNFYFVDLVQNATEIRLNASDGRYIESVKVNDQNVPIQFTNSQIEDELGGLFFRDLDSADVKVALEEELAYESRVTDFRKLASGLPIILKHVTFESNEAKMKVQSYSELDQLLDILTRENDLELVIFGHTDNMGNELHNLNLSEQRALSISDYLTSKGIPKSSITTIGKGSKAPIASNLSPAGRKQNRRVEVMLVR